MEQSAATPAIVLDARTAERMITASATSTAEMKLLRAEISGLRDNMKALEKRLLGNGQPGELDRIRAEAKEQEKVVTEHGDWITRADEREKTNLKWVAWISGLFGSAAATAVSLAADYFRHKK